MFSRPGFGVPLALLLFTAAPGALAQTVLDGTMEAADTAAWRTYGAGVFAKSGAQVYNGTQSMHVQQGVTAGFQQMNLPLEAGKTYRLRVMYRRQSGSFGVRIGVNTSNRDFEGKQFTTTTSANAWTAHTRVFTVPNPLVGSVRVVFLVNGEAYVDDVTITENSVVDDGDMEQEDNASWVAYGVSTFAKTTDAAQNGSQSMVITSAAGVSGGCQQRAIAAEPNAVYLLSFWYRRDGGTFRARLGMNTSNTDSFGGGTTDSTAPVGVWRQVVRTVTMPEVVGDVRLVFAVTGGTVLVDDVTMAPVELVEDWNMETVGTDAWRPYGVANTLEKTATLPYAGARSLHLIQGGIQQPGLQVVAGATYQLTVVHRLTSGRLHVRLGINTSNYDFAAQEAIISQVGDWAQYTRTFTVPNDFTSASSFRLVLFTERTGAEVSLDNVSIRPL